MSSAFRTRFTLSAAALTLSLGAVIAAQLTPPPAVDAGSFQGTWTRREPQWKQVVMLRQVEGGWRLALRWEVEDGVSLDTAFQERTEFSYRGQPGSLSLSYVADRSTPQRLTFHYERRQSAERGAQLLESGDVQIYRSHEGRHLVWWQDPLRIQVKVGEPLTPDEERGVDRSEQRLWVFVKQSDRELQPDEIAW